MDLPMTLDAFLRSTGQVACEKFDCEYQVNDFKTAPWAGKQRQAAETKIGWYICLFWGELPVIWNGRCFFGGVGREQS